MYQYLRYEDFKKYILYYVPNVLSSIKFFSDNLKEQRKLHLHSKKTKKRVEVKVVN